MTPTRCNELFAVIVGTSQQLNPLPRHPFRDGSRPTFCRFNGNQRLQCRPIVASLSQRVDGILIRLLHQIHKQSIVLVHTNRISHLWVIETLVGGWCSTNFLTLTREAYLKRRLEFQLCLVIDAAKHQQSVLILRDRNIQILTHTFIDEQLEVLPVSAFKHAVRPIRLLRYRCSVWHAGVEIDAKEPQFGELFNL